MKIGSVKDKLRELGENRGTLYMFEYLVEQNNVKTKQIAELTKLVEQLVDTVTNVVNGTVGMREQMIASMKRAGLKMEEDDLDPSTHNIGMKQ